jgi:hypothetical protein
VVNPISCYSVPVRVSLTFVRGQIAGTGKKVKGRGKGGCEGNRADQGPITKARNAHRNRLGKLRSVVSGYNAVALSSTWFDCRWAA